MVCCSQPARQELQKRNVAVVGAGAAGLAAARELLEEGHKVDIFEQGGCLGGTWVLDEGTDSDALGQDPSRSRVHSSMYHSLRTNLPRELMSFYDYPFQPEFMKGMSKDGRRFPHHTEVLDYLQVYAAHHNLNPLIQLNTDVVSVCPVWKNGATETTVASQGAAEGAGNASPCTWKVVTRALPHSGHDAGQQSSHTEKVYDAVMVCSGHYSVPRIPEVQGINTFPGRCEHSHNYRSPDKYSGKKVLVLGAHASGVDIAWEVAGTAPKVYLSSATLSSGSGEETFSQEDASGPRNNMHTCSWLQELCADGTAVLQSGARIEHLDVIIFCTGYYFSFPFLEEGLLHACDDYVKPLFQHLYTPQFGASLSFIGIPLLVAPFLMCSVQSKYVARLLSGKQAYPPASEVQEIMHEHYSAALEKGVKARHIHKLNTNQWAYMHWFADRMGIDRPPVWREELWEIALRLRRENNADCYRDVVDPEMEASRQKAQQWAATAMPSISIEA